MECLTISHLANHPITLGLFTNVQNAAFLREQLIQGNTAFEYAFLDASVLVSRAQVLAACFRAINDMNRQRMRSRNVHSEIVFSLSPNNNIAESFRRFGVSETTTHLVAIKVDSTLTEVEAHLSSNIQGNLQPLTDEGLAKVRDDARIRKIYHVDAPARSPEAPTDLKSQAIVLGSMALRGS